MAQSLIGQKLRIKGVAWFKDRKQFDGFGDIALGLDLSAGQGAYQVGLTVPERMGKIGLHAQDDLRLSVELARDDFQIVTGGIDGDHRRGVLISELDAQFARRQFRADLRVIFQQFVELKQNRIECLGILEDIGNRLVGLCGGQRP